MSSRWRVPRAAKEGYQAILAELARHGVTEHEISRNGADHLVVSFLFEGKEGRVTFPGTPSNRWLVTKRGRGDVRAEIRRIKAHGLR